MNCKPRFVHEHEGIGVDGPEPGQLHVEAPGHEIEHEGPHRVVEKNRPLVLVEHVEAEADGSFELAPDGGSIGQVEGQKTVVNGRIGRADVEDRRIVEARQHIFQFFRELVHGKTQGALFQVQDDAGKMLGRLDIHVFVIIVVGQLGPEGHIQGEGHLQGPVHVGVGHYRHGGGQQVSGDLGIH